MSTAKANKVLIITSSGGGGLLQAATAKKQEILENDPNSIVIERDVMKDWMLTFVGEFFVRRWNNAQTHGNVLAQTFFGTLARFMDWFFWPHFFVGALHVLFKEDIDQVLDTQIFGTSATIKAIRWFNHCRNKSVYLQKVIVDLPTKKAIHFFPAIKALSNADRKYFKLITIAPLLEEGQTKEEFWLEHCNLTENELQYEDFYIRLPFKRYRHALRTNEPIDLFTGFDNESELDLLKQVLSKGSSDFKIEEKQLKFHIPTSVKIFTVLLGSQPASDATMNYTKKFIELGRKFPQTKIHLFVFCSKHDPNKETLFRRVADHVTQANNFPRNLTIIPMSFQKDHVIAPLFFRSDATCTRSGGQTAMELMCTGRGKVWIHSESKKENPINEDLLKGIPVWESGNAVYMQRVKQAEIVTPELILPLAEKVICRDDREVCPSESLGT